LGAAAAAVVAAEAALAARRVWAAAAAVDFAPETSMLFEDRPVPLAWTLVPSMASIEGRETHRTRAVATTIPVWRVRQPFWTVPTSTAASPMELMPDAQASVAQDPNVRHVSLDDSLFRGGRDSRISLPLSEAACMA
jgi:hypothetical protein